ncbi:MAG TPA: hypothetical protein PKD79_01190 [Candidatus Doudnabacteria bacterium]|nr:hypothetical protein [Candidatus Doudnabacteria bacterium]
MNEFNVMPPVGSGSNQPVHEPRITTPPPPTPEVPIMSTLPSSPPPNKFSFLKYLLILPILLLLGGLVFGYLVIVKGQTSYGQNLQDKVWVSMVNSTNTEAKDLDFTITYTDKGSYQFKPSNFVKPFGMGMSESEYGELDSMYSFTIEDPSFTGTVSSYMDLSNTDMPKTDTELKGSVYNFNKTFDASLYMKLKDTEAYVKYDYNTNVDDLFKYLGFYNSSSPEKNRWMQTKDEQGLKDMREIIQYVTLLKDFTETSADAKRVADIRQIASALELYYNDNNEYPPSENGKPVGLTPMYLQSLPVAPPADGKCSDDMNEYRYTAKRDASGRNTGYSFTFCLGKPISGFEAGNHEASENGIRPYTCPSNRTCEGTNTTETTKSKYQKLLSENRLLDIKTLKGISIMDGTPVFRYELEFNKDKFKGLVETSINDVFKGEYSSELRSFSLEISNILIDKIDITNYEVWVGVTNKKLYKSTTTIDALSITKAAKYFETSLNDPNNPITRSLAEQTMTSQASARDSKRIADIRQMSGMLELYFNDYGEYPPSDNGQPTGATTDYMPVIPTAPMPPDGECDEYHNTYWYTRLSPTSYKYEFCLGSATGGLPAGLNVMTEMGIQTPIQIDRQPVEYYDNSPNYFETFKSTVINTIKDLEFDAEIKIEYSARGFGKIREIESPTDFIEGF